jgi:hypothetical protein
LVGANSCNTILTCHQIIEILEKANVKILHMNDLI